MVARWHGHIRYDWLAYKAVKIARYYKNALLAFESNTFDKKKSEASEFVEEGDHIRGILKKIEDIYPNLYMRAATDPEDIRNGIYKKIGFQTNKKTKQDMVDNFIVAFEDVLLAKRQNSFYCTYFLHNRNVADTKSPYPIKRLEVIRRFNQKDMAFNQSLS